MKDNESPDRHYLDAEELRNLREGLDSVAIYQRLRERCLSNVALFSEGISREDLDEIVSDAISEAMPKIKNEGCTVEDVNQEIQRALWKFKKRCQRCLERTTSQEGHREDSNLGHFPDPNQGPALIEARDMLSHLVQHIEICMSRALKELKERDRMILMTYYGLNLKVSLGIKEDVATPTFTSAAAEKKAIYRARTRFNHQLDDVLSSALLNTELDHGILEDALKIIRGGKLEEILAIKETI